MAGWRQRDHNHDNAKYRQILEGALQVFRTKGFDGASMEMIAKAANVPKGTLYVYFDSKEVLFESLIMVDRHRQGEALVDVESGGSYEACPVCGATRFAGYLGTRVDAGDLKSCDTYNRRHPFL